MTVPKITGVLAGIAGVVVLMGPDALHTIGPGIAGNPSILGQDACLGAALSYACAGIYGRRFRTMGAAPLQAAAGQVSASTLLIFPIMVIAEPPLLLTGAPSLVTCAALAALALLSTALAYVLYFRILAAAGATNLLLVTFLVPVTAILLAPAFSASTSSFGISAAWR